ncbi:MAG TPA: carbohydrate kinase family protein [Nitrososphaerales archaeon]|nr:carbohydrate kinase family protein [Nitrososphaerales archaeon]
MARRYDVAVMHDYFVDRLVHTSSLAGLMREVGQKAAAGGGGLHGIGQEDIRGGNAVNLAHALARLGLRTLLITHSERGHLGLLEEAFRGLRADVRVKPARAGLTVAFEEKVNVMLGDGGGAADFGPGALGADDWDALERSRVVCSVNWAANRRGTELLAALRKRLGREKPIFIDPADFRDRALQFRDLLLRISKEDLVDWVSMNQGEAAESARLLGMEASEPQEVCRGLARKLKVVFDLHTEKRSYTSEGTEISSARVEVIRAKRLTGAGDIWDAGAIYGRLKGMDEASRLRFANRAARLYLQNEEPLPPTADEVLRSQATSRASAKRSRRPC